MSTTALLLLYCVAIVVASLLGGVLPLFLKLRHTGTQLMLSAVAGFMLGVAVLHMLGEALPEATSTDAALLWMIGGLLTMFFVERFLAPHSHELPTADGHDPEAPHACGGGHGHDHTHPHVPQTRLHWLGTLAGMSIHSLIAGTALAAAVAAATLVGADDHEAGPAGFAVLLALLGHKPLDALTVVGLAHASGLPRARAHLLNFGFSLVTPLGALAAWFGLTAVFEQSPGVLPAALAFSAGTFLCIALSDLLPEIQFHKHDRFKLTAALLLGLTAAWSIGLLEGEHAHGGQGHEAHGHEADAHEVHGHEPQDDEAHAH